MKMLGKPRMKIEAFHIYLSGTIISGLMMIGIAQVFIKPNQLDSRWSIKNGIYNETISLTKLCDFDSRILCREETKWYNVGTSRCHSKPYIYVGEPVSQTIDYSTVSFARSEIQLKVDNDYCEPVSSFELLYNTLFVIINVIGVIFIISATLPLIYQLHKQIMNGQTNRPNQNTQIRPQTLQEIVVV
jgi:hypothetical protein